MESKMTPHVRLAKDRISKSSRIPESEYLPNASAALIVGTMLTMDRPFDMYRTVVNIFSDSVGTVVVAKSEGETGLYANT